MSSNSTQSHLPTPDTYLNHFTPSQAARWEFDRNIYLAILGATIWDVLVYIPDDIKILRRGIKVASWCFVFSRVFIIIYLILSVLMYTHPIANCQAVKLTTGVFSGLGVACFAFLFVLRVHAVYHDKKKVQWTFSCLWLFYVGTLVAVPFGLHSRHRSHTSYCVGHDKKDPEIGSKIAPLIFDSLVFLVISYRIAMSTYSGHGPRITWNTIISGKAVPRFSRAVLQGGQQYYLLMVIVNLVNVVVLYTPEASAYREMFNPLGTALGASMACRVYRNIMLFEYKDGTTTLPVNSTMNFARNVVSGQTSDGGHSRSDKAIGSGGLAGVGTKHSLQGYEGQSSIEVTDVSDKHFNLEVIGVQRGSMPQLMFQSPGRRNNTGGEEF